MISSEVEMLMGSRMCLDVDPVCTGCLAVIMSKDQTLLKTLCHLGKEETGVEQKVLFFPG